MNFKKLGVIVLLLVIIASSVIAYKFLKEKTGENYYVQLIYEPVSCKENRKDEVVSCDYKEKGYNDKGNEKTISFSSFRERPLRKDAYLVVTYNNAKNAVVKYKEVKKDEIPKKALEKLEKNKSK